MEIKALSIGNLAATINATVSRATRASETATTAIGMKAVTSALLASTEAADQAASDEAMSAREAAIDDDALNHLTPKDMLKLIDMYADAQVLGIDPMTIDAMAVALGAKRRKEEELSGIVQVHASKESVKLLRDAIHQRVRDSEQGYDARGRLEKTRSTFSLFG